MVLPPHPNHRCVSRGTKIKNKLAIFIPRHQCSQCRTHAFKLGLRLHRMHRSCIRKDIAARRKVLTNRGCDSSKDAVDTRTWLMAASISLYAVASETGAHEAGAKAESKGGAVSVATEAKAEHGAQRGAAGAANETGPAVESKGGAVGAAKEPRLNTEHNEGQRARRTKQGRRSNQKEGQWARRKSQG